MLGFQIKVHPQAINCPVKYVGAVKDKVMLSSYLLETACGNGNGQRAHRERERFVGQIEPATVCSQGQISIQAYLMFANVQVLHSECSQGVLRLARIA